MVRVIHQSNEGATPRTTEVGEIDTRAPFQSVRAAVNLFGAVATMKSKPSLPSFKRQSSVLTADGRAHSFKRQSSALSIFTEPNNVLDKEAKLMLADKELNKLKQQLHSAETTKAQALQELESANHTLGELHNFIHIVHQSKQSVTAAAEALKEHMKKLEDERQGQDVIDRIAWEKELDHEREQYKIVSDELDNAKQYLTKIRQDFDAALEAKLAAFNQVVETQSASKHHIDRAAEIRKEIAAMKDSIEQLKSAATKAEQESAKINEEKESIEKESQRAMEEAEHKLRALKEEFDLDSATSLETELAQVTAEIQVVQDNMSRAHESEMNSIKDITDELNQATKRLQEVAAEESELHTWVAALRLELENVKKEAAEAKEREARSTDLKAQLESAKTELEAQAELNPDEHVSQLHQLTSETEEAKQEAEETRRKAEEMKQEAETARAEAEETEQQLRVAMTVLGEAKAGEEHAADELRNFSATDFGPAGARIKMSKEEYEALQRKDKEAGRLAETKVTAMMFQVGVISASKIDAECKIDEVFREIVETQAAIDLASKQTEMCEAARRAIQTELKRWRQQEQEQKQKRLSQLQMCAN